MNHRTILVIATTVAVAKVCAWSQYRMDFVTVPGKSINYVTGINDLGNVVVTSGVNNSVESADTFIRYANGVLAQIPRVPGFWAMELANINNQNVVVGSDFSPNPLINLTGMKYTPGIGTELLPRFGPYPNNQQIPTAINRSGIVTGYTDDNGFSAGGAVAWNYPGRADGYLPFSGTNGQCEAADINDAGTIVGSQGSTPRPVRWRYQSGTIDYLPMGSGCSSGFVTSINESGWMVGMASRQISSNTFRSYLQVWDPNGALVASVQSGTSAISAIPATDQFVRGLINDNEEVIVSDFSGGNNSTKIWLWSAHTGLQEVGPLIQGLPSGSRFWSPTGFNNLGQITCNGVINNVAHNNILLTPVPEPGSLAVLALGAVGLLKKRRKA